MNYELAKKLKEAGFPSNWELRTEALLPYPTLSELIAACGVKFHRLEQAGLEKWCSYAVGGTQGIGSTPEEAVARLWLALQGG